ncbi:MAG: hypothetical protein QM755_04435 [Luteolibacter sp.]
MPPPLQPGRYRSLETFRPITLADKASFWQVGCLLADGTKREMIIEEMPDGKMAVDWGRISPSRSHCSRFSFVA